MYFITLDKSLVETNRGSGDSHVTHTGGVKLAVDVEPLNDMPLLKNVSVTLTFQ